MHNNTIMGGGVTLRVGGKEYPLIFNFAALISIENKYKKTFNGVIGMLPNADILFDLLNAGLQGYDGDLARETDIPPLVECNTAVLVAAQLAYYGTDEPDEEEKKTETKIKKKK